MTSFSSYKNNSKDVDFLVSELAKTFDSKDKLNKTASVISSNSNTGIISELVSTLVKSADFLENSNNDELLSEIDKTLTYIDNDIIK